MQADILGTQHYGYTHNPSEWMLLRCRWFDHLGIIESSRNGVRFEPMWTFRHRGLPNRTTAALLVGTVPFNGQAKDCSEPGPVGECTIGEVLVHGRKTE